ncbi:Major facilitator family transporter [Pseudomonas syringae pv. tomato]|nr:Major facilitator family transporter [Pseudomonas syringae pv. maculicola]RMQ66925.1 Major facilitator family transporter [Pseudomonas syringae pv. tomato]RMQ78746.1 Major facilitator family transporter [Pseudomonas syringae pv. tomato]
MIRRAPGKSPKNNKHRGTHAMTATSTHEVGDAEGNHVYRRITLRLIPFIFICYLFNYLDRVNVGFAKLQMLDALSFSETVYGLGAGIFFIGYVLCGLPSNLALNRFGPRRWIGLMMITWGIFSTCLLFVTTPVEFYVLRFLTGMAEAGFFPGIVLYLSRWYPNQRRGRIMALFMSAIPVSGLLGGPFSGWILNHFAAGQGGMAGWQWMFLIQGLPTVALGVLAFFVLCDKVEDARWLTPEQRQRVKTDITHDELNRPVQGKSSVASVLTMPFIWVLGFIYFCIQSGVYAINFWLPSIIKNLGFSDALVIGWISAVPYLMAGVFMLLVGRSADLRNERRWHLVVPMLMGATGLIIAANFATVPLIAILGLTIATMGALTSLPMFWPLPTALLSASVAAGGLALINSIGQMAGFLSPYLVGWIKDQTGSTTLALYSLAALTIVGSLVALRVSRQSAVKVAAAA